ncbi:Tol-pal system protein YbgF [Crenothrix polyspora]|uniref:Cell division coordinator CpoB n=1 Tax=Crenothrix polyspora TaxID=360316 RepID=A0A1R4HAZ6_9GAMM|nr:tol-pal system protein YbgF [Crenothrix polyspora]SJM93415.1 Tol-pal system protein YbgF [Crenothrix polyspora]
MNMRFAILSLCAATSACAENLPPVVDTSAYPPPQAIKPVPTPSVNTLNQMMNRNEQLQKEIQQLTGKVEDQVFLIEELKKQQKTMYSDFDERLQALENKGSATPEAGSVTPDASAATPGDTGTPATDAAASEPALATDAEAGAAAAATTESASETKVTDEAAPATDAVAEPAKQIEPKTKSAEAPVQASDEEKQEYQQAYTQLSTGHAPEAIAAFDAYLVKYPSGGYASNSQYWLGEAYRVKQDNDAAKAAFNKVVDNYPGSPKVPDALLKLGYIEIEQNNPTKAREYLTRISTDFPNSNAAYLASKKLATLADVKP